jgi:hypothetical protein
LEFVVVWGRFSPSTSFSPSYHHSTYFSIIIITLDGHNMPIGGRSAEWTQLDSTPTIPIKKRRRWVGSVKMVLRKTGLGGIDWIDLAQDRDQWRALVNTAIYHQVPYNVGNF